jgi:uncharacterized protein YkwD
MNPALLTVVLALNGAPASTSTSGTAPTVKPKTEIELTDRILELTNLERERAGLRPLRQQQSLVGAAKWLAENMASRSYFNHTDHLGRSAAQRVGDFGYLGWTAFGENIAAGKREPEDVVSLWMGSPKHRQNILNPTFTEIGIGYVAHSGSLYGSYWVQTFGAR